MVEMIQEILEEVEDVKSVTEEVLDMLIRQQAKINALVEILVKNQITDEQEIKILEEDNLNELQYSLVKED